MAFNPKTVFGLCTVLYRHSKNIQLNFDSRELASYEIEHLAKKMDLIYRESKTNWHLISKNPESVLKNLTEIETLYRKLVEELYNVEEGIQKQLSRNFGTGGFNIFRKELREQFDKLRLPIKEVKEVVQENRLKNKIDFDSVAVVETVVRVWKTFNVSKKLPRKTLKNPNLKSFMNDILEVFEIKEEANKAYKNWYRLTQ